MKNFLPMFAFAIIFSFGGTSDIFADNQIVVLDTSGAIYSATLEEGLARIHWLASHTLKEDVWIYSEKTKLWYDVGKLGQMAEVTHDFSVFYKDKSILSGSTAVCVHIHPYESDQEIVDPPLTGDLEAFAYVETEFAKNLNAKVRWLVYDGVGIWEVKLSAKNIAELMKDGNRLLEQVSVEALAIGLVDRKPSTRKRVIGELLKHLRSYGIDISYKDL